MPKTAKWLIRKLDLKELKGKPLVDPNTNVALGTAYLNMLREDFDGSFALSSAAYNAGPVRARIWRKTLEKPMEAPSSSSPSPIRNPRLRKERALEHIHVCSSAEGGSRAPSSRSWARLTPSDPTAKEADLP